VFYVTLPRHVKYKPLYRSPCPQPQPPGTKTNFIDAPRIEPPNEILSSAWVLTPTAPSPRKPHDYHTTSATSPLSSSPTESSARRCKPLSSPHLSSHFPSPENSPSTQTHSTYQTFSPRNPTYPARSTIPPSPLPPLTEFQQATRVDLVISKEPHKKDRNRAAEK
jgi:hypothetical protein